MPSIRWGRLLSGSPAEIELSDVEAAEFARSRSYQDRARIVRVAALRVRLIDLLLTADGRLVPNIVAARPEPGEQVVWLRAGECFDSLDEQDQITLSPETAKMFRRRGRIAQPRLRRSRRASNTAARPQDEISGPGQAEAM